MKTRVVTLDPIFSISPFAFWPEFKKALSYLKQQGSQTLDPFFPFFLLVFGLNLRKALSNIKQISNLSKSLKFQHKIFFV